MPNAPTIQDLYLERIYLLESAYNQERDRADRAEAELAALRAQAKQKDDAITKALAFHDRYCDRVGAADNWARAVHAALRAAATGEGNE